MSNIIYPAFISVLFINLSIQMSSKRVIEDPLFSDNLGLLPRIKDNQIINEILENIDIPSSIAKDIKNYINKIKINDSDFYIKNILIFTYIESQINRIDNAYGFEEKMNFLKTTISQISNQIINNPFVGISDENREKFVIIVNNFLLFFNYYELKRKQKLSNDKFNNQTNEPNDIIKINYYNNSGYKRYNTNKIDLYMSCFVFIFILLLSIFSGFIIKQNLNQHKKGNNIKGKKNSTRFSYLRSGSQELFENKDYSSENLNSKCVEIK